jgi:hypothetical protein
MVRALKSMTTHQRARASEALKYTKISKRGSRGRLFVEGYKSFQLVDDLEPELDNARLVSTGDSPATG